MHFSVTGLPKALTNASSVNSLGKPPMMAPLGAMARASGIGARSKPNFLTISCSAGSVTWTIAAVARSETLATASSKTFFMAVVCSFSVFQKKPNRYLLSLAACSINAVAVF